MSDEDIVHTGDEPGADEAAKIWKEFEAMDRGESPPGADPDPNTGDDPGEGGDPDDGDAPDFEDAEAGESGDGDADGEDNGDKPSSDADGEDIWANVPEAARAVFKATLDELNTTKTNYTRVSGTVSALQRKLNQFEKGQATPGATPAAADVPTDLAALLNDPEVKAAADEYPEVFKPMMKVIENLSSKVDRFHGVVSSLSEAERAKLDHQQTLLVHEKHPDYDDVAGSDAFLAWYEQAPKYIRDGIERNAEKIVDGIEVADIVAKFKADTGYKPAAAEPDKGTPEKPAANTDSRRKLALESAAAPRGRTPARQSTDVPPPDAPAEQHWAYFERLDRQKAAKSR